MRVVATSRAKPELASQAENVSKIIGAREEMGEVIVIDQREMAMNRDNIMPSKQIRADKI